MSSDEVSINSICKGNGKGNTGKGFDFPAGAGPAEVQMRAYHHKAPVWPAGFFICTEMDSGTAWILSIGADKCSFGMNFARNCNKHQILVISVVELLDKQQKLLN